MRLSPVLLLIAALMALASPALAAPQTTDDGDDAVSASAPGGEKQLDARRVVIDQAGESTTISISVERETVARMTMDAVLMFLDTNEDSRSDRFVSFYFPSAGKYSVISGLTPNSVVGCQRTTDHGDPYVEENKDLPAADGSGWQTLTATVPTARLGGATSFRWAVYANNDSFVRATYDHVPDSADPRGRGSGTAAQNLDGCDTNGDGAWGGSGDENTSQGAYPVALTDGVKFPTAASQPSQPPAGPGADNPLLPDPALAAIPAPLTLKTIRFPDVGPGSSKCRRLCTVESVEKRLQKMGLRNYELLIRDGEFSDIPKRFRKYAEHGHVVSHSPAAGEEISEPNLSDYPDAKRPKVRLYVWHEPQLEHGCDDPGIKGVLRDMPWPGTTVGAGSARVYGAEDILEKKRCKVEFTWRKSDGVTEPRIERVSQPGSSRVVRLGIVLPKKPDLEVAVMEGAKEFPPIADLGLVGPAVSQPSNVTFMPATGGGQGAIVVRVMQLRVAPTMPAPPGTKVRVIDDIAGGAQVVAEGRVSVGGLAVLRGNFGELGTYRITADYERAHGHTLDGETTLEVRKVTSNVTTESGRRFRFRNNRWELMKPASARTMARAAQYTCQVGAAAPLDVRMGYYLDYLAEVRTEEERSGYAALFVNAYLHARKDGLLASREMQDFLTARRVSLPNIGEKGLKPVGQSCSAVTPEQVRHLVRGVDLTGATPVISTPEGMLATDGTLLNLNALSAGMAGGAVFNLQRPRTGLTLLRDDAADIISAVISTGGGNATTVLDEAARGVISTGGGNVISTGGGNMTVTNLLTLPQIRAMMAVLAKGGQQVISTGGGNVTDAERAAGTKVIQTGNGNLIGQAGGNLTADQYRALLGSLAVAARLISDKGLGLTAAENDALQAAVISTGGGNVISTGGGNVISTGGGNLTESGLRQAIYGVISTGGGNLAARVPLGAPAGANPQTVPDVVQAVISTGGGNIISTDGSSLQAKNVLSAFVSAVISTGGGNLTRVQQVISTGGGNFADAAIIGQDTGSIISDNGGG